MSESADDAPIEDRRAVAAIVDAAEAIALDRDLTAVTVDDIAESAGVSPGSVREHFGTMEGVALAVAERAFEATTVYMDAAYSSSADPVEQLRAAARWYVNFHEDHPSSFRLLAFPYGPRRSSGPAAMIAERVADKVRERNERLAHALQQGIDAGLIRPVDPRRTAIFLWAAWNGVVSLRWRPDAMRLERAELDQVVELAVDVVSNGLLAPPKGRPRRRR